MSDDYEKYNRHEWMSDNQWECMLLLSNLFGGFHHMRINKVKPHGTGIAYNTSGAWLSTYDFDTLTRLVLLSHKKCIRSEIAPSGPGLIKIILHKRKGIEGAMHERHPDLQGLITMANLWDNEASE